MEKEIKDIFLKMLFLFGQKERVSKAIEELSELIIELSKIITEEKLTKERMYRLVDELADSSLMIDSLIVVFDLEKQFQKRRKIKIQKIEKIIKKERR